MGIQKQRIDESGKTYGRLYVNGFASTDKQGKALFDCTCECGVKKVVPGHALRSGNTSSCGYRCSHCIKGHKLLDKGYCVICKADTNREYSRGTRYGLAPGEYDAMLSDQDNKCAICSDVLETPNVDHDHSCCPGDGGCGRCVRGLLCRGCNVGLGSFRDNPDVLIRAADYLYKHILHKVAA